MPVRLKTSQHQPDYEPVYAEKWRERVIRSLCRIGEKRRKMIFNEIKNLTVAIKGSLGNDNGEEKYGEVKMRGHQYFHISLVAGVRGDIS